MARVRQFCKNSQKIQNLKKFERFNRFWPNSIPKFLGGCNIFVCSFRTIARILRKLELPRPFFKRFNSHKITNRASNVMKIVTIKGLWSLHWRTKFHIDISSRLSYRGFKRLKSDTYTHAHTHTSGLQLKIKFLDVLDYSEYSDTNISKKIFSQKQLPQWGSRIIQFGDSKFTSALCQCKFGFPASSQIF